MESVSGAVLLVLAMVAFANYRNGTLGPWLKAKFLNAASPLDPAPGGGTQVRQVGLGGGAGVMRAPVAGTVTGRFGENRGDHNHAGVDYAVPIGTPVAAARAGRVTYAGPSGAYGLRVDVDHGDGIVTRYAHLSRVNVRLGETVGAGQTIAASGNSGRSTGPHLHFEVRDHGVAKDPAGYLGMAGLTAPNASGVLV